MRYAINMNMNFQIEASSEEEAWDLFDGLQPEQGGYFKHGFDYNDRIYIQCAEPEMEECHGQKLGAVLATVRTDKKTYETIIDARTHCRRIRNAEGFLYYLTKVELDDMAQDNYALTDWLVREACNIPEDESIGHWSFCAAKAAYQ